MNPFGSPRRNPPPTPKKGGEVLKCEFYDVAIASDKNKNSTIKKSSNLSTEICGETLSSGKVHCYGLWLKSNKGYVIQKKGCWINDAQCRSNPKCYPIRTDRQAGNHVFCCCHGKECNAGDRLVQKFYSESSIPPPVRSLSEVKNNDLLVVSEATFTPPSSFNNHNSGFIQSPHFLAPAPPPYDSNNFFASLLSSAMSSPSSRALLIAAMTAVPLCLVVLILFALFFAYNYRSKRRSGNRLRKRGGTANAAAGLDATRRSLIYDIKPCGYENRIYPNASAGGPLYDHAHSRPVSAIGNYSYYEGEWDRLIENPPNPLTPLKNGITSPQTPLGADDRKNGIDHFLQWAFAKRPKPDPNPGAKLMAASLVQHNSSQQLGFKADPSVRYKLLRLIATSPISRVYLGQQCRSQPKHFAPLSFDQAESSHDLAIKIYPPDQKESWDREIEVYRYLAMQQPPKQRHHPNLLPLVDARTNVVNNDRYHSDYNRSSSFPNNSKVESKSNSDLLVIITPPPNLAARPDVRPAPSTHAEYWLVTEYQENGSLLDYLEFNTIGWDVLISIALDISSALAYLHSNYSTPELPSANGSNASRDHKKVYKPAIAHKDLKSKNIFLNRDLVAQIGDFGAAVVFTSVAKIKQSQGQRGTLRYMAPEILEGAISFSQDCFLKIDVYAFALILWELMSRCHDINSTISQYKMPYEDELSATTTLEEMQDLICTRNLRPKIPDEWTKNKPSAELVSTVKDCWERDPEARISAITIHERIKEMAAKIRQEPLVS